MGTKFRKTLKDNGGGAGIQTPGPLTADEA